MKKAILLAAGLALAAAPASANSLFYAWNTCLANGGAATINFDCAGATAATSWATYTLDNAQPGIVAVSAVLDLSVNGSPDLPGFWHMEGGGCNFGGLEVSDSRAGGVPACTAAFTFGGTAAGASTDPFLNAYGAGFGGANKARVLVSVNRASSDPAALAAAPTVQFGFKLNWLLDNAVEAGGLCTGCGATVSQALNTIVLESAFANAGGDAVAAVITSTDPGSQGSLCTNGTNCDVVPAKNRSWGQLKSLFR